MSGAKISHYRIQERLGVGGMGIVHRAVDEDLDREVAIKVLPPGTADDERAREVLRSEARAAAKLDHPNIGVIHEVGETEEGQPYLVMALYEGGSLKERLADGPLAAEEALRITREVCAGLGAAHAAGIVHLDIKPGNILFDRDGRVKIVDFGLAGVASRVRETRTERTAGTVAYMAAEQITGNPVDSRTDLYALGVVLYEMLTGRLPYGGDNEAMVLHDIVYGDPPDLADPETGIPRELGTVLHRLLSREPDERYSSAVAVAGALGNCRELGTAERVGPSRQTYRRLKRNRWGWSALFVLVLVAALAGYNAVKRPARSGNLKVAVLPFEVVSETDWNGEFIGRATADALSVSLLELKGITLIPVAAGELRTAAERSHHAALARGSGADYVLTGVIYRTSDRYVVTVKITESSSGHLDWGKTVQGSVDEIAQLTRQVADGVTEHWGLERSRLYEYPLYQTKHTVDGEEVNFNDVSIAIMNEDVPAMDRLSRDFVERFPDDPEIRALRVFVASVLFWYDGSDENRASMLDELAVLNRLDPHHPMHSVVFARMVMTDPRQTSDRLGELLERHDLSANLRAYVLRLRGDALADLGQLDQALADAQEALQLQPLAWPTLANLSRLYRRAERFEDALVVARQAAAIAPNSPYALESLGFAYARLERWREAGLAFEKSYGLSGYQGTGAMYAVSLLESGDLEAAIAVAKSAEQRSDEKWGTFNLACFWVRAGDADRAFEWLDRSLALGLASVMFFEDPALDPIRSDPRYAKIAAEVSRRLED